jgi:hypothetical protein
MVCDARFINISSKTETFLVVFVTEPPNYDGPHVPVIVIMTSNSRTYVPHNLKGLLSSEQDPITQEYCNITTVYSKYRQSKVAEVLQ